MTKQIIVLKTKGVHGRHFDGKHQEEVNLTDQFSDTEY